jgi:hypothetical protein
VSRWTAVLAVAACGQAPTFSSSRRPAERNACLAAIPADADAPRFVVYDRNPWLRLVGSDFPTVAVWADGTIVFTQHHERAQATIASARFEAVAARILPTLRASPPFGSLSNVTDQPTVELVTKDGDQWHDVHIYGLTPDSAADGAVVDAYRQLLAMRPTTGTPFQPVDIQIVLWSFDNALSTVAWPADVPAPADLVPDAPKTEPSSVRFVVATKYQEALAPMFEQLRRDDPSAVELNGHKWTVVAMQRYRGQATIDQVLRCARIR